MLKRSKHIMPAKDKKEPYYIVMGKDKNGKSDPYYIKQYGICIFPTYLNDEISETTGNIWEAAMFCNKKDAIQIAKLCSFKCGCGCINRAGKLIRVTKSDRKKEGITYGHSDCRKLNYYKEFFETVWDISEEDDEYRDGNFEIDGKKLETTYKKNDPSPKTRR